MPLRHWKKVLCYCCVCLSVVWIKGRLQSLGLRGMWGQREEEENILRLLEGSCWFSVLLGRGMVYWAAQLVVVPALLISTPCCVGDVKHIPNAAVTKCLVGIASPLGLDMEHLGGHLLPAGKTKSPKSELSVEPWRKLIAVHPLAPQVWARQPVPADTSPLSAAHGCLCSSYFLCVAAKQMFWMNLAGRGAAPSPIALFAELLFSIKSLNFSTFSV